MPIEWFCIICSEAPACRKGIWIMIIKRCRKCWTSKVTGWLCVFVVIPWGIVGLICGICSLLKLRILESILNLLMGAFFVWFGYIESTFELRKYSITPEGLWLGKCKKVFYKWDQIYDIGIFPFGAATSLEVYCKVICCSFSPPPANFKRALLHDDWLYAARNQDNFIIIDYDEETINEFSAIYQKNIVDYTEGMKGYGRCSI